MCECAARVGCGVLCVTTDATESRRTQRENTQCLCVLCDEESPPGNRFLDNSVTVIAPTTLALEKEREKESQPTQTDFLDALCARRSCSSRRSMEKLDGDDYYKLLGVSRNATEQEINKGTPPVLACSPPAFCEPCR